MVVPNSAPALVKKSCTPFSKLADAYIQGEIEKLDDEIYFAKKDLRDIPLPPLLIQRKSEKEEAHGRSLRVRLDQLCSEGRWSEVDRNDIVCNLSSLRLSETQKEVLSLGLKFDTGSDGKAIDFFQENFRYSDCDVEKGVKQGVVAHCLATRDTTPVIPRRYIQALRQLRERDDIVVTSSDKGGGVAIMDRRVSTSKMEDLLSDLEVYEASHGGAAENEARDFNKQVRTILSKSETGKGYSSPGRTPMPTTSERTP